MSISLPYDGIIYINVCWHTIGSGVRLGLLFSIKKHTHTKDNCELRSDFVLKVLMRTRFIIFGTTPRWALGINHTHTQRVCTIHTFNKQFSIKMFIIRIIIFSKENLYHTHIQVLYMPIVARIDTTGIRPLVSNQLSKKSMINEHTNSLTKDRFRFIDYLN